MGRTRAPDPATVQRQTAALARTLIAGFEEGLLAAFVRVMQAAAHRLLGLEVEDVEGFVRANGVQEALRLAAKAAAEAWPDRWREELSAPISAVMQAATEDDAPILGAFDLANPKTREFLDGYVSELAEGLAKTSYDNVRRIVEASQQEGASVDDVARQLREGLPELNDRRAMLIARTETIRAANGASLHQAIESGVVTTKTWTATMDARTRPEHMAMHGTTVAIDAEFPNGEQYPGEPNCRCTLSYGIDLETPPDEAAEALDEAVADPFADDDPFAEDFGDDDEETEEERYEREESARLVEALEREERSRLYQIIISNGGIKTNPALAEEYRGIPNTFKRKDGFSGDDIAALLANHYPEFGIESEDDLIQYFVNRD